ncbi:hypothetical protein U1Q18_037736 [Sarracenia purpurea var. burkii]
MVKITGSRLGDSVQTESEEEREEGVVLQMVSRSANLQGGEEEEVEVEVEVGVEMRLGTERKVLEEAEGDVTEDEEKEEIVFCRFAG